MHLSKLEVSGFKSFAKKTAFYFGAPVVGIVGPNGSGKSNVAEAIRFVLGEQSMKSMRGKRGEDLIWNGSNTVPRANRASAILTFNNTSRFLDVDFDEVSIERVVNRDGTNEYRLNGSIVRLKDIVALLAGANIGQTGHHIISQGEADKILSASPRERREMLEDALGLKVFQYKKDESVRKLEKTEENMRHVEALRKEVQPHLRFLKRQVDKIQKTETLRNEAQSRFQTYFQKEDAYIRHTKETLTRKKETLDAQIQEVSVSIKDARATLSQSSNSSDTERIVSLSENVEQVREQRRVALQEGARIEGQLEALEHIAPEETLPRAELERFLQEQERAFGENHTSLESAVQFTKTLFTSLRQLLRGPSADTSKINELKKLKQEKDEKEKQLALKEREHTEQLDAIRGELEESRTTEREKERALFGLTAKERELRHALDLIQTHVRTLLLEEEEYTRELSEVGTLIGHAAISFGKSEYTETPRDGQRSEKNDLQKIKIRLEEAGASGGAEVLTEYKEVSERETFLEKEIHDLTLSSESLRSLTADLDSELSSRFKVGMLSINKAFSEFFSIMFDGGSASLVFVKEPPRRIRNVLDEDDNGVPDDRERMVEGIDVSLSIPRKRIKSLVMLSGGERALTSIALIFAMSSVNPPPFLVLDETDAALDEANSRRYGDMIKSLSEKSQLVLITHNRETMSRAHILYGVTMGGDGVSKTLSIKLEDAVQVAK